MYVYLQTEPGLFTVGHYDPTNNRFVPESDHATKSGAAARVCELNGGAKVTEQNPTATADPILLRDHLAAHALTGLLAAESDANGTGAFSVSRGEPNLNTTPAIFAKTAYLISDAMLEQRKAVRSDDQ